MFQQDWVLVRAIVSVMIALDYGKSDNRWIKGIMVTLPIIGISFTIPQYHSFKSEKYGGFEPAVSLNSKCKE